MKGNDNQAISPPYQLYTARDAAKLLAISERHLFTLTQRGEIVAVRMGRAIRYSSADWMHLLISKCNK